MIAIGSGLSAPTTLSVARRVLEAGLDRGESAEPVVHRRTALRAGSRTGQSRGQSGRSTVGLIAGGEVSRPVVLHESMYGNTREVAEHRMRYNSCRWQRARFVQKPTPSSAPDQFVGDFGFASCSL